MRNLNHTTHNVYINIAEGFVTKLSTVNIACVSLPPVAELSSSVYWRTPFSSLCNHRQLTEFYVLHIEKATPPGSHGNISANHSDKVELLLPDWPPSIISCQ